MRELQELTNRGQWNGCDNQCKEKEQSGKDKKLSGLYLLAEIADIAPEQLGAYLAEIRKKST